MAEDSQPTRRRLLAVVAGAGAALAAAPALRLVVAPAGQASGEAPWVVVGRLAELVEGTPRRVKVIADEHDGYTTAKAQTLGTVWLVRRGADVKALSAACPHLGCAVDAQDGKFFCPCHTSWFEIDGARSPGKPNKALRGMDPLAVRIVGPEKTIEVQFRRFAMGTESREALG